MSPSRRAESKPAFVPGAWRDILRQRVNAGLKATRRRGLIGGRPKSLDESDLKKARALLRSGEFTKVQVAKELEVSRHTLWRALSHEEGK